ncbi:MAG: O-antigen ligase family protein, partial [Chloroflexota bacterium]
MASPTSSRQAVGGRATSSRAWSLVVAGEALLVLFLLTWGNSFTASIGLHRIQLAILAILGGIGWLAILQRPGRLPVLLIAAPLPILASLALTSIGSAYPSLSWFATWQCAAYVGIAWLVAIQASDRIGRRNLVAAMGIVVVIVIGVYLIRVGFAWVEWLSLGFPIASLPLRPLLDGGVVQLPTWVGDVIALCAPIVVVSLWMRHAKGLAVALAVVATAATLISGTRSVLLMVVIVSVVILALVLRARADRRVALIGSALAGVVVIAGLGVVLLAGRSFDEGRLSTYASAVDQFSSAPLMGTGPGTYAVLRMGDDIDFLNRLAFPDANNVILTAAGESGLVGLLGLGLAAGAYGLAIRRSWLHRPDDRGVKAAALFGLTVFVGHALVEATFVLIGLVLLMIANVSIAATGWSAPAADRARRVVRVDVALATGIVVIVVASAFVVRNEWTLDAVSRADGVLDSSASVALAEARRATDGSPETVPAWWVRMLAADATGDSADAAFAAERTVELEGFGQEWLSLAMLKAAAGDTTAALDALDDARLHGPIDPLVELNT